jgi:hypothetical protein
LRDLSRILTLLNRSEARLGAPPPDWDTLLDWAERSLRRYKKSVGSEGAGGGCSSGATSSSASSTPTSSHALNHHTVSIIQNIFTILFQLRQCVIRRRVGWLSMNTLKTICFRDVTFSLSLKFKFSMLLSFAFCKKVPIFPLEMFYFSTN